VTRIGRSVAIANEVEQYLTFLKEKILPYAKLGGFLPPNFKLPQPPPEPDCLDWLDKVDRWGFPVAGTWLDQPMEFMADLDAARMGKQRFQSKLVDMEQAKQVFIGAPPPVAMVGGR